MIIILELLYTDDNYNISIIIIRTISRVVDTVTDTTSCGTADNAVSEIENRHHL